MDTHITTAPDIDERIGAPIGSPIRLPGGRGTLPHLEDHDLGSSGEAAGDPGTEGADTSAPREKLVATPQRPARRMGLLSTAAVVVMLAGVGGAAWAERQGALNLPLPPILVSLLRTGLPATSQMAGEVGVTPSRSPARAPAAVRPDPELATRAARQQAEFTALKGDDAVAEVGVAANGRPVAPSPSMASPPSVASPLPAAPLPPVAALSTAPTPSEPTPAVVVPPPASAALVASADPGTPTNPVPAAVSAPPPASTTPAVTLPAVSVPATPAPAVTSVPASPPAPKPRDPVQTAAELQAEPMSPKQQVEVVGLVRELGAQLKESRLTVAQLQTTVADLKDQLDSRMTEFDGRLGLAEAGTVLAQSAKAGLPQPVMAAAVVPPVRPVAAAQRLAPATTAPAPAGTAGRSVKDFRVQGASPGLAVLNVVGAAPGEAPVLYVALGDQVPGIGRIKSIYQRGTTWLVQTDAGLIQ